MARQRYRSGPKGLSLHSSTFPQGAPASLRCAGPKGGEQEGFGAGAAGARARPRAGGAQRAPSFLPSFPPHPAAWQRCRDSSIPELLICKWQRLHGPDAKLLGVRAPEGAGGGARRGTAPHAHLALHGNRQWSSRSLRQRTHGRFERQRVAEEGGQTGSPWQPGADGRRLGTPRISPRRQDGEPGVRAHR